MDEQPFSDERETAQRQIHETRVQELQQELHILFDSSPAMIWYRDTQNRILRVNQVAADSIGLSKDLIEGRAVADFYPEDADRYYQDDCIVIESGMPKFGIVEPYRLPSGEERWLQTNKVPLKNGEGTVTGILVMAS
jgi:PAS domain S-box-containing protein